MNIFHKKLFYRLLNVFCFDFLKLLFLLFFLPDFPGGVKKNFFSSFTCFTCYTFLSFLLQLLLFGVGSVASEALN